MSNALVCVLIIFVITLIVASIVLGIYLLKLIDETKQTMKSIRELTDLTKKELEPALKSVNSVLKTVDDVSISTNRNLSTLKKVIGAVVGTSILAFTNIKKGGFLNGFWNGFNLFSKRR